MVGGFPDASHLVASRRCPPPSRARAAAGSSSRRRRILRYTTPLKNPLGPRQARNTGASPPPPPIGAPPELAAKRRTPCSCALPPTPSLCLPLPPPTPSLQRCWRRCTSAPTASRCAPAACPRACPSPRPLPTTCSGRRCPAACTPAAWSSRVRRGGGASKEPVHAYGQHRARVAWCHVASGGTPSHPAPCHPVSLAVPPPPGECQFQSPVWGPLKGQIERESIKVRCAVCRRVVAVGKMLQMILLYGHQHEPSRHWLASPPSCRA